MRARPLMRSWETGGSLLGESSGPRVVAREGADFHGVDGDRVVDECQPRRRPRVRLDAPLEAMHIGQLFVSLRGEGMTNKHFTEKEAFRATSPHKRLFSKCCGDQ